jgi:hypothetical protein
MSGDSQYEHEFLPPNTGWQHRGNGGVYAPIDASTNRPMPWVALACLCGGLGFGGLIILCILAPWRAQSELSEARMRAEFSDRFAKVEKNAADAATVSEIWRNRVNKLEAEANANR